MILRDRLWMVLSLVFSLSTLPPAVARPALVPDATANTIVRGNCGTTCTVEGGTQAGRNLFHSFRRFGIPSGATVRFPDAEVSNVLVRVTGNQPSALRGTLAVSGDTNFFLLNPNGIVFGTDAQLDLRGSFVATTADAVRLGRQGIFSANQPTDLALLTVNPSAFLFSTDRPAAIVNRASLAPNSERPAGQSFILLGGAVQFIDGSLAVDGGRVELGGLASQGEVGLQFNRGLELQFPENLPYADVSLADVSAIAVEDGNLRVTARSLSLQDSSDLSASARSNRVGGEILIQAQDQVTLTDSNIGSDTSSSANAGRVTVQAQTVSLRSSIISTQTLNRGRAGQIDIQANTLLLDEAAALLANTAAAGAAGQISITTTEAVRLRNFSTLSTSGSFSDTDLGNAGRIRLQTGQLSLSEGSSLTTDIDRTGRQQGEGGNIAIAAGSIQLSDGAEISAKTAATNGGNLTFRGANLILLDRQSSISANAGTEQQGGNGGNINISAQFLVANPFGNSDITANAYRGDGGQVNFRGQQIFGITPRDRLTSASDITATSAFGQPGVVTINRLDADPSRGLTDLPIQLSDAADQIIPACPASSQRPQSRLWVTGRGGLPSNPADFRSSDRVLTHWSTLETTDRQAVALDRPAQSALLPQEAQGWILNPAGQVQLVVQAPDGGAQAPMASTCASQ